MGSICHCIAVPAVCQHFHIIPAVPKGSTPAREERYVPRNLPRRRRISVIDTHIRCFRILIGHLPEGILDDAGDIMFIVRHIFIQSVLQAADRNYIYAILPSVRVVSNPN